MVTKYQKGVSVILSTSATNKGVFTIITLVTIIFSRIYNSFSHDVHSIYMTYAFLIPLLLGALPNLKVKTNNVYNASVITLTIYSLIRGFLEIYGTTNNLINIYLYVSIILLILSFFRTLIKILTNFNHWC